MKLSVYNAVAAILGVDETLSEADKSIILDVCRDPAMTEESEHGAGEAQTLLTLSEVAAMLQVHVTTVRRIVKQGRLRRLGFMRYPRFLLEDVERLAGLHQGKPR